MKDASDNLRKRWDDAPHHPDVSTHPHHVHEGSEETVRPHGPMTTEEVLMQLTRADLGDSPGDG